MAEQGRARGVLWGCALTALLIGLLLGLKLLPYLLGPYLGSADTLPAAAVPAPDRATLADLPLPLRAGPGMEVSVDWLVTNAGGHIWTPGEYRFLPRIAGLPVLPLPLTVRPGQSARVRLRLAVGPDEVGRTLHWSLAGPRGPVPGGDLELTLLAEVEQAPAGD